MENLTKTKKAKKVNVQIENVQTENLNSLNAENVVETLIEKSANKSIFKKEFSNKKDRTNCRNKFIASISRFNLFVKNNKEDLAKQELEIINAIASKYYIAENSFKSSSDYCTNGMQEDKKALINEFVESQKIKK